MRNLSNTFQTAKKTIPISVHNTSGSVAIIMGLAVFAIFLVVGFSVESSRHVSMNNKVQNALDAAALACARTLRDEDLSDAELDALAQNFFASHLLENGDASLNTVNAVVVDQEVILTVDGELDATFMTITGRDSLPLAARSAAVFDKLSQAEVALVLDTSHSMAGARLSQLKVAANGFVETLLPSLDASENEAVKIAIVPFSTYVNVGLGKRHESWLNTDPATSSTSTRCYVPSSVKREKCRRVSRTCTNDGIRRTCQRWDCPSDIRDYEVCGDVTTTKEWHGCVASRNHPFNIRDESYGVNKVWGFATNSANRCPSPISPLNNNQSQVKSAVNGLAAREDTYIATGLTWGLRTLSPGAPFTEGADYAEFASNDGRKVIVLMSDGANTRAPVSSGLHTSSNSAAANATTLDVCDEIKDHNIEIYTIAFDLTDMATISMLTSCATDTDYFYDVSNASELNDAFADIGNSLKDIAISQ